MPKIITNKISFIKLNVPAIIDGINVNKRYPPKTVKMI